MDNLEVSWAELVENVDAADVDERWVELKMQ